ncbi:hypothetical protein ABL78_0278 [Leptomonas seymouri]|uniref:Vacuolar protein sorting-associated protein 54 C-terminal domain-containing protein n=1 Tax=Leptomonas seymouri TaxID=5684 RepID=A0A0N1I3S8_LEPSE|nr:hypothetical protein ABL78_0278 [Leptomonas seymouri]|eukprot:KPI90518.1 hypothetical protein ABL78_0278 [Leptomonas seymouri]
MPTSSTHLNTSDASVTRSGHDAAASICAHLIVYNGLSRVRIAHAVGLPALVIEESIKNGVSSATLRAQLCSWLYEAAPSQKLRVPTELFAQLQEECAADAIEQQHQRGGVVSSCGADHSSFSALDSVSQAHFAKLQRSVGQSFISILNDPGEPTTNVDWSTWIGGKLYEAFDFNGSGGSLEDLLRSFKERQVGPDSAAALLAESPPNQDFSAYVKLISDSYQANRREGIANDADEWREETSDLLYSGPTGAGSTPTVDGGPWPHGVPSCFFEKGYDASMEVIKLSEVVGESMPTLSASPPVAAAVPSSSSQERPRSATVASTRGVAPSSSLSATDEAGASLPKSTATPFLSHVVNNTTFTDDFEYLESRNKELRAWESAVEKCLLHHVKHRSEDFFVASKQFGSLSGDARSVLMDVRVAREGGMRAGEHFVSEYLRIGQLYRRRQNFVQLQRTATTAQRLLRRLGDVENWAALPERDFGEMLITANALVDLEAAGKNVDDSASRISWNTLSKLQCLAEVPMRVRAARKALEKVVLNEYARALLSDLGNSDAGEHVSLVCASVTRLGILSTANQLYHVKVVEELHIAAQEAFVSFLMNTGTLDDKSANELLTVVASNTTAFSLPAVRQQLCGFAKNLRYDKYQLVLQQFVDALIDFVTQVSQNWGFFVTGGLHRALAVFDNGASLVQQATRDLLARVCGEAESLVASMLEVYASGEQLSSAAEVLQLVRIGTQFPLRVTNDVAGRLALLLDSSNSTARRGSLASGAEGEVDAASARRDGEPIGFIVYRPTKVIGTSIQRLAKQFFRRQHRNNKEKITMVTEGETWAAKGTVDAAIQREVEEMCTSDTAALERFRLRAVAMLLSTGEDINGGSSNSGSTHYPHQRGASSFLRYSNLVGNGELLDTDATKLYVRLPRSSGAATAAHDSSTSFSLNSSTGPTIGMSEGVGAGEVEEGRLVANSLLVLMDLLHKYNRSIATFPFLAFDVASRMVELIDAYEGQTAAMVLGARAVEKKTLSTITTQHLCVASQCVSFLNDFIPALQAHLTAAMTGGTVMDAARTHGVPRDAVAVACALGLIPSSSSVVCGRNTTPADGGNHACEKTKLFVENDWNRVLKNCRAHRNEFFSKMGSLVYRKVESLGSVSVQTNQWSVGGNEWVMAMLREVARLMRTLRPLLPLEDMDGVVVPLIGMLSILLREATTRIPVSAADDRAAATSDIMLFKANVEKFGYDVLTCAKVTSVSAVMQGGQCFAPVSSDEAVLAWFLPTQAARAPQRSPAATQ